MTFKYKLYKSDENNYIIQMGRMSIPVDPDNSDYDSANANILVRINKHQYRDTTGI